ncbi:MAG: type II secretion system F family protein [Planctomycetes bacterium]|nr:type II secretion system F family protein [Planctomycetota bacterium]
MADEALAGDTLERQIDDMLGKRRPKVDSTKISVDQFLFFNRQIASMARLNLPLSVGLRSLSQEVKNPSFRKVIEEIQKEMDQGVPLQEALAKYPKIFSPLYLEILRAGESTGNLAEVLEELAVYSEEMADTRTKLIHAIAYPAFVSGISGLLIFYILVFAVPQFKSIFTDMGRWEELFPLTKAVIAASDFLRNWQVSVPVLGVLLAAIVAGILKLRSAIKEFNEFVFHLPVFGGLFRDVTLFKICRTLGDLLRSGVSIIEALSLTAGTAGKNKIRVALDQMRRAVENGERMSDECKRSKAFPETLVWKLTMGEERGQLEDALDELSTYYRREVGLTCAKITNVLEPVILLFLSVFIGFLVMSLYLPLFSMHNVSGM